MNIRGVVVPMISPLTPAGAIDEPAVGRIVDHLVAQGVHGIFPLGTTGESASITVDEKRTLAAATARHAKGRATLYAGIASTCFRESVDAAAAYQQLSFDAAVAHVPSYYPLDDDEVEAYFLRLADAISLPLVLYNIPATTHRSIPLNVVDRLRRHPNIVAIKDSAQDRHRLTELLQLTGGPAGFPVLVGSSVNSAHGLRHGAAGLVPSGGHLIGDKYRQMFDAAMADRWDDVERLQQETDDTCAKYLHGRTLGQGLAAMKALLEQRGLCGRTMLPPLRDHVGDL